MSFAVLNRTDLSRYEVQVGGRPAGFIDYTDLRGIRVFTDGRVDPEFEGHGLGSAMMKAVLEAERSAGNLISPRCAFMRRFIERNPQYRDLVAAAPTASPRSTPKSPGPDLRTKPKVVQAS